MGLEAFELVGLQWFDHSSLHSRIHPGIFAGQTQDDLAATNQVPSGQYGQSRITVWWDSIQLSAAAQNKLKKYSVSHFKQSIINPRSPWRRGIWGQAIGRVTKLSLFYGYSEHQLESREVFHTHFQIKKYPLWWDLTKPQLMGISTRNPASALQRVPSSGIHTKGYSQTLHDLLSHLAAAPCGSINAPPTANQPHPTSCK